MSKEPISVLIVDDEPVLRELVAYILHDRGFIVSEADSGDAAFARICEEQFDVVLSDVRMPHGNGLDLLNKVRELEHPRPVVFLLSGYAEISLAEAKRLGAEDLIFKPVDYDKLCVAINSVARRLCTSKEIGCDQRLL